MEMEADRTDGGDEDDDGDDDPHHDGKEGVRLPGVLGSHPPTRIEVPEAVLQLITLRARKVWPPLLIKSVGDCEELNNIILMNEFIFLAVKYKNIKCMQRGTIYT